MVGAHLGYSKFTFNQYLREKRGKFILPWPLEVYISHLYEMVKGIQLFTKYFP
jgi:hypothetical protein